MIKNIYPVILCGGSGTRLWPLSRTVLPKQFITLHEQSLFEDTLDRVTTFAEQSFIICGDAHRFLATSMMMGKGLDLSAHQIMLEPEAKNTALAIALAAFAAHEKNADATIVVLPSDHILQPVEDFVVALEATLNYAQHAIVTFGITPDSPHTGYGYIEKGDVIADNLYTIQSFREKPAEEDAQTLLEIGASWNSGMFFMKASLYLEELKQYRNDIYEAAHTIWHSHYNDLHFIRFDKEFFAKAPAESIDYAVMEKTEKALVYPLSIEWSDLGSFTALHEKARKDEHNNSIIGDVIVHDASNSYIHATNSLVAVHGLDNVAVVQTKDAVLVSSLNKTQEIKALISDMKALKRTELHTSYIEYRPWGHYESLINSERFQVKHISVNPGGILSVQMHHHRSEHWIIVHGTALVRCGDTEKLLTENESIYIPLGEVHRLSNPGCIQLDLIEVQTGSYLGEDDITRFEDAYGRSKL